MEDREERGAGQRQRRKMQAGLHLDYEIFITCLLEWGQHRSPATASPPGSALKCTGPGGRGHHGGPHLLQRLLREGAEEVKRKGKKEQKLQSITLHYLLSTSFKYSFVAKFTLKMK